MGLSINQQKNTLKDRYHLETNRVVDFLNLPEVPGVHFIMSMDSEITTADFVAKGCYAATTDKGTVKGHSLVVTMLGIHRQNARLTCVDPTLPANLSYIDGCSNSNLVDPDRNGDPCLNHLYFPKGIDQTFHVHPSVRIGIIVSGQGYADFVDDEGNSRTEPLRQGDTFVLNRFCRHRFRTTDSIMSILVFHPDSEDGPRDEYNPMKTRTYLR